MLRSYNLFFSMHFLFLVLAGVCSFAFTNCSEVELSRPDQITISSTTFNDLKPVLAVRQPACILCHAKINGNFITDFGLNSPYFFGLDDPRNHPNYGNYGPFHSKHFVHSDFSWYHASIMGDFVIPRHTLTNPRLLQNYITAPDGDPSASSVSIKDFLSAQVQRVGGASQTPRIPLPFNTGDPDIENSGLRGDYVERDHIYIGAPTEEEMESLKDLPGNVLLLAELGATIYKRRGLDLIRGLRVEKNPFTQQNYVTHDEVLECAGDIIISSGVVLFKNLKLKTNDQGCRIYAKQSVFLEGPIEYVDSSANPSLQITSSRAITMGMKSGKIRFTTDHVATVQGGIRQGPILTTEQVNDQKILNDFEIVKPVLEEAGPYVKIYKDGDKDDVVAVINDIDNRVIEALPGRDLSECGTPSGFSGNKIFPVYANCEAAWADAFQRKSVNYEHLLLNAPKVHSRYHGVFKGSIIAEDALFSVGNFRFERDPSFDRINLLPLIRSRVFSISEN